MNNLNALYKGSPTYFLANYVLTLNPSVPGALRDPRELETGLQHFDIRPLEYPGGTELKFYMDAGQSQHVGERVVGMGGRVVVDGVAPKVPMRQAVGVIWRPAPDVVPVAREAPIHAYWLPYEADYTYETELGNQANYFFTAGLSGCCIVVSGNPVAPRVAHINRSEAGSPKYHNAIGEQIHLEDALAKRRAEVQGMEYKSRTSKEAQTSRQIMFQELKSKVAAREERLAAVAAGQAPRDTSRDLLGYCKWGEQYDSLCGVVGVRNQASGEWRFYYQRYRNVPAPRELAHLGFVTQRDGGLNSFG